MIQTFVDLVRDLARPGMVVCEVGCHAGDSVAGWLPIVAANGGRAILVDWFKGNEEVEASTGPHSWLPERADAVRWRLKQRVTDYNGVVTVLDGDSAAMAKEVPDASLDVCFLDADHRYQRVKADLEAWEPKVKPGGVFCGHDLDSWPPSSKPSAHQLAKDCLFGIHYGVVWAVWERYGNGIEVLCGRVGCPLWVKRM